MSNCTTPTVTPGWGIGHSRANSATPTRSWSLRCAADPNTLDGFPGAWARAPSDSAVLHDGDPDALIGEAFERGADRDLYKDAYEAMVNPGDAWLEHQLPF